MDCYCWSVQVWCSYTCSSMYVLGLSSPWHHLLLISLVVPLTCTSGVLEQWSTCTTKRCCWCCRIWIVVNDVLGRSGEQSFSLLRGTQQHLRSRLKFPELDNMICLIHWHEHLYKLLHPCLFKHGQSNVDGEWSLDSLSACVWWVVTHSLS